MSHEMMFPAAKLVAGRVINSLGEPLDGKGSIASGASLPLISLAEEGGGQVEPRFWETGIKVIDLLAPLALGKTFTLAGETGTGLMVVIEELMETLVTRYNGYVIGLSMDESGHDSGYLLESFKEFQEVHESNQAKFTLVFEPPTEQVEVGTRMLQVALTLAQQVRSAGHEVMLIVDEQAASQFRSAQIETLKRFTALQGLVTLLMRPTSMVQQAATRQGIDLLDGQIVTTRELAQQYLWPAVDRLLSTSNLLESHHVSAEHGQVAEQLRRFLGAPAGSSGEQENVQRLQNFLTQPFFVAELYTGQPGEYVPVEVTVAQVRALLEGQYADIPPQTLMMVGTIEQAIAKNMSDR